MKNSLVVRAGRSLSRGFNKARDLVYTGSQVVVDTCSRPSKTLLGVFAFAFGLLLTSQGLYAQVTLPDTGVDVAEYVSEAISTMGTVMAAVVGGYVAFLIVKRGMRYIGRAI